MVLTLSSDRLNVHFRWRVMRNDHKRAGGIAHDLYFSVYCFGSEYALKPSHFYPILSEVDFRIPPAYMVDARERHVGALRRHFSRIWQAAIDSSSTQQVNVIRAKLKQEEARLIQNGPRSSANRRLPVVYARPVLVRVPTETCVRCVEV